MERELITVAEAGKRFFGVSRDTAQRMAVEGTIPTIQVGRRRKVDVAEMKARIGRPDADAIGNLVRQHISTIEMALLLMANMPNVDRHSDLTPSEIAELAEKLRGLSECAL